ncbi:MAG: LacI family DNA-binding transcriptional regulator [Aquidulcibacter sp.]|jgi:LacI family transcriptional regulator|uniref:LacI family DNA-binding transcriptional regulator n=1 Tax=Aquidulcibacter sp. TaxID=2052990 RepID=UPI0022CAA9A3|nr:LacI family DNA-binding transcriptional regulator [Aquidulcibacter sp.]MCZ8210164.1 LacI family DNA-binding transcriptional regulator [Aquidulcibacter sp.]
MGRRNQSVTISHVAADAGVSLQTVSRVINNEPNVRPEMKARVQASIEKLHYVPSIAAQRMSGSRSYLILAINDRERTIAEWHARRGADWVDQMLLGGMLTCAEHGYRMIFELVDTHNDHVERELSGTIAALQPDGIILTPPHSENPLITNLLEQRNIPFARIGSLTPGSGFAVHMDDAGSAVQATQHLIDLGHERIGFIAGAPDYNLSHWRVDGWRQAMAQAGLSDEGLCVQGDFSYENGREAAAALLDQTPAPTAIIASNDQMALATLDIANERNVAVPSDLSIISFDNTPVVRFTNPQLTAVDQPIAATFSKAVELLIHQATAKRDVPYLVKGSLVERASTAPPRA